MAHETSVRSISFTVTIRAVIHLHTVPRMHCQAGDISSPDIAAVACNPVLFVNGQCVLFLLGSVTGLALDFRHEHMGCMGKIHANGLA